jgi:8-oxo-dGTP pyrophosphatase MutT (NUDIX family)
MMIRGNMSAVLRDGEEYEFESAGQRWVSSWHCRAAAPAGRRHGSAGICVTEGGEVVLASADGKSWDFPAGRPEGDEGWEETLRREMLEEACAVVTEARLLGFCRGRCVEGAEAGLVLVRSIWMAKVEILDWRPQFEMKFRCVVPPREAMNRVPGIYEPIWRRALIEGGLDWGGRQ